MKQHTVAELECRLAEAWAAYDAAPSLYTLAPVAHVERALALTAPSMYRVDATDDTVTVTAWLSGPCPWLPRDEHPDDDPHRDANGAPCRRRLAWDVVRRLMPPRPEDAKMTIKDASAAYRAARAKHAAATGAAKEIALAEWKAAKARLLAAWAAR